LAHLDPPIAVTYLEQLPLDAVLQRVAALPPRSVVLLGSFLTDAMGRRLGTPEVSALISGASAVPVYGLSELSLGHGVVGGHLLSYTQLGQQGATLAARVLRGERPPSIEAEALTYRFDARQLQRWHLDARRAPPGSTVEFESPSLWHTYRLYIAAALLVLALQSWTIVALLASRAHRRRAQQHLAGQLRFETLISDVLASHLTAPAEGVDWQVRRALARIGEDLDVDRVVLGERDESARRVKVTHEWTRDDISEMAPSISWATYPWIAGRLSLGQLVVVSPRRPLPPEAEIDRQGMHATGTRSLLAVPLAVEGTVVGVLSCATVRTAREWPTPLIDRLQLLAGMFAT